MPTLRLSDSEVDTILNAAKPLAPERRDGVSQRGGRQVE
jgi:hypothetical protein